MMLKANSEFENFRKSLNGQSADTTEEALRKYQLARGNVTSDTYRTENSRWNTLIEGSPKDLWNSIDWKGNLSKGNPIRPSNNEELALHFEKLYESNDPEETSKIEELSTNIYNPNLDDPIAQEELDDAVKEMKKGGYDYNLNIVKLLTKVMSPLLLLLFNIMFYVGFVNFMSGYSPLYDKLFWLYNVTTILIISLSLLRLLPHLLLPLRLSIPCHLPVSAFHTFLTFRLAPRILASCCF